jgi:hypothetical protein
MFYIDTTIDSKTRFDRAKLMAYDEGFDILDSYFVNQLLKLPKVREFKVAFEASRPDIISYKMYGDAQYWWIIMLYNDISDETTITSGMVFNGPSLSAVEDLYFSLKAKANT